MFALGRLPYCIQANRPLFHYGRGSSQRRRRPKNGTARFGRLNQALRDKLRVDRSDHAVSALAIGKHGSAPAIAADNLTGKNALATKSMIVKLYLGLDKRPKKRTAG